MKTKKFVWSLLSILIVASMALVGCTDQTTETEVPTEEAGEKLAVGIVLPTKDEPRWIQDETRFKDALTEAGY
ncbi:MAG: hypothetical protein WA116_00065, partial [Anaerolineaceae bacterium]